MNLLSKIAEYFLGHKYYGVVLNRRRSTLVDLSTFIFPTKLDAEQYFAEIRFENRSCDAVEIFSFRSHRHYQTIWNEREDARQTYCNVRNELPCYAASDKEEGKF